MNHFAKLVYIYLCTFAVTVLVGILYLQFSPKDTPVQIWNQGEIIPDEPMPQQIPVILKHKAIITDTRGSVIT